jgi:hypothetical protein
MTRAPPNEWLNVFIRGLIGCHPYANSIRAMIARSSAVASGQGGIDTLATNEPGLVLNWVMLPISYARHRFPPDIIRHAVWLYLRFMLSYRDVEDLLAERGLMVSSESIRRWFLNSGQ